MEKTKCKLCGKDIEGFTKKDAEYRLYVHMAKHRHDEKKQREKAQ